LVHHSVFFGQDYPEEFDAVFQRSSYPGDPTVYICAQDRADTGGLADPDKAERMLMVINAPPNGNQNPDQSEMEQCMERSLARLEACGLKVDVEPAMSVPTGPEGFNRLFPATGGALYGRANHSPFASFQRPDNRTKIPRLYLAGGSVHPGPGVPMAALSGRLAAARVVSDLASTRPSRRTVTVGGMSTAWAMMAATGSRSLLLLGRFSRPTTHGRGAKTRMITSRSMSRSMAQKPVGR
jgi:1-hydroxycarotenoid 3,4-desaturase